MRIIIFCLLLLVVFPYDNSLCFDCQTALGNLCIACKSTGCNPYSVYAASTKQCFCRDGYYTNNDDSTSLFCGRCFMGCLTCTGPLSTNCITCAANFTLDASTYTCAQPYTTGDWTIDRSYYFLGFGALSGWSLSSGSITTQTCSSVTLLGTRTSAIIRKSFTGLSAHFQSRVMFAHFSAATINTLVSRTIGISYDNGATSNSVAVSEDFRSTASIYPSLSCSFFVQTYIDKSYIHTASSLNLQISISSGTHSIRQFYLIIKLCNSVCASCTGYTSSQCTSCTDANRLSNVVTSTTNFVGKCVCVNAYYEEPVAKTCVNICPALPVETFGDNNTRSCVTSCPNNTYALTDVYRCWLDCPTTSLLTTSLLLFKDKLNWRCVPNCPSAAPYANKDDRTCYLTCPSVSTIYYAVDGHFPECVSVCPYNASFYLFGYQGKCIPRCPSGTWGNPLASNRLCISNCNNATNDFPYKDNSSGLNICVRDCTSLNFFRDNSTFTCVTTCPATRYGQTNRECVTRCADGSFGLPFGNRKCTTFCPEGWWGEPDLNICVNTTAQCKTTTTNATGYFRYADNYTRKCVYPYQCSLGFYADNSTQSCVPKCPSASSPDSIVGASVGYPVTKACQLACPSPYFRDFVAGLCTTTCITNNTYADVHSTRTCVTACNTAGATPWADNNTWTCVSNCNATGIANFISDNSTFRCVFNCPSNSYADRITSSNPTCRLACLTNTYKDNSTGTGTCSSGCSIFPPRFADATGGMNQCVAICTPPLFGDQTGIRPCVSTCPSPYYSQNDTTRLCVTTCKPLSYATGRSCFTDPKDCPINTYANDANTLCDACNANLGTWGDPVTKRCVTICPLNPTYSSAAPTSTPITYYTDVSSQLCVLTCSSTYVTGALTGLFGNNNTRGCVAKCQDVNAFAKIPLVAGGFRLCVARCYDDTFYANNQTKVCVLSRNCPTNQYGQNITRSCLQSCPTGSWAYATSNDRICIDICPLTTWYGDSSTSKNICVLNCPSIPSLFADPVSKLCVVQCPISGADTYYSDPTTRKCVLICPANYYKYTPTRQCLKKCTTPYFGLNVTGPNNICVTPSSACGGSLVADPFINMCVTLCSGATPVSLFKHGFDCIAKCPDTFYSNVHNSVRQCTQLCPPGTLNSVASPNLYGDNSTQSCVSRCVSPLTWADPSTRLCASVCAQTPPLYSENFGYTCVSASSCPISPSMSFGDNNTRSCVTNCSSGKYGDPVSRYCLTQCPGILITGISNFYGDSSTGQFICVVVCPILPRLFGDNTTNRCVSQCTAPLYGQQTGNRSCLAICPEVSSVIYFAQNLSRICVSVCTTGTWGYTSTKECVQVPTHCGTQWADNTTNLCVTTCPATANTFGDITTKLCVTLCPNTTALYFSDVTTRLCVVTCPASVQQHGTYGNNQTRACEEKCSILTNGTMIYADPQTVNRYCVTKCSQTPNVAFADPSTQTCVSICPTYPSLFGERINFTCVRECPTGTYANTHTRLCESSCPSSEFKVTTPNMCVTVCPADRATPLYGDNLNWQCSETCTGGQHRYKTLSICVASCSTYGLTSYNSTCIKICPSGFYNQAGVCISACTTGFGQNSTAQCVGTCITGFASGVLCLALCPTGTYGQSNICRSSCQISGNTATNVTNTCVSNCTNGTYSQSGQCSQTCTTSSYADPLTNLCSSSCSNVNYFGDPTTNKCVLQCPSNYYKQSGFCVTGCSGSNFADNVTWSCRAMCSTGYWGHNKLCLTVCPSTFYGYQTDRICYTTATLSNLLVLFANNITQTWVTACPISPLSFGDRTLRICIPVCLGSLYSDPVSRQCQTNCVNASYYIDITTNFCVLMCPALYYSNSNNGKCQDICTTGYAYHEERKCVGTCPDPYSGYDTGTAKICVLRCPLNYYSLNNVCDTFCPSPYYADNSTNYCVTSCVGSFASRDSRVCVPSCGIYPTYKLSDNSTNECVTECPSLPDYYSENNICVLFCQADFFSDATAGQRKCTSLCTNGLFSNPVSRRCQSSCPQGYWAQNLTSALNKCETLCSVGFADNSTGRCELTCPSPTYADPTTKRCVKICPATYFGEVNFTCTLKCQLYNYANPLNRLCQPQCPPFAGLFAQNTTASCVTSCAIVSNSYADRNTNQCVTNCSLANEYMLDIVGICTSLCPSGQFMQNSTKRCQPICSTGFAEPTSRYCVARCYGNPQTYGYDKVCHYRCKNSTLNFYADNSTNLCVETCPLSQLYFNDPLSGNCVRWCPEGYFSETDFRTCSLTCKTGQFADNLTRSCVGQCPTATQNTYGEPNSNKCLRVCPNNMVASNTSKLCVNNNACPPDTWSDIISKYCVTRCPSSPLYFGLNSTTSCVIRCPNTFFGDHVKQICESNCIAVGGQYRFADPVSQTCVYVCPISQNLYGDSMITNNHSCVATCTNSQLKDNSTQRCVAVCPSNPSYWANPLDSKCVYYCPLNYFASNQTDRLCVDNCSVYSTFVDFTSQICANVCPENYWADNITYSCVDRCPSTPDYFADNVSRSCVLFCPKTPQWITFADQTTRRCVTQCPAGYFAVNSTQRCQQTCPNGEYADPIIRVCVQHCTVRPHYYKTNDRKCVFQCQIAGPVAYKLQTTHVCVYTDGAGYTGCSNSQWADITNNSCTTLCPDTYYADQVKQLCVRTCPLGTFADEMDRLCKSSCVSAPEQYRLNLNPGVCVQFCPSPYFADNSTFYCVDRCPNIPSIMYSFEPTRTCVLNCPPPYYSHYPDNICRLDCPDGFFAQDSNRSCVRTCLSPYFADDSTERCVLRCPDSPIYFGHNLVCVDRCPDDTYADNSTRLCSPTCPTQPVTFADNSTNKCVTSCPSTPNYYADRRLMKCVFNCSGGQFNQVTTRTCVINCPADLNTYADITTGVCQSACPSPYFASNLTKQCVELCPNTPVKTYALVDAQTRACVFQCPSGLYGQNITRVCAADCTLGGSNSNTNPTAFADRLLNLCVSTCSYGWFGDNSTFRCVQACPLGSYADNTTRRCLARCPGSERLYDDSTTLKCVSQCPVGSYGSNQNWTCISTCPPEVFGYKLDLSNLCIEQCPEPFFAMVSLRSCVITCGAGLYGDSATRICNNCPADCPTCVSPTQCQSCSATLYLSFGACLPTCPNLTYANNASRTCVFAISCPPGLYGNGETQSCSSICPVKQYANNLSKLCLDCPQTCASCSSPEICLTCVTNAAFSNVTKQCYQFCSPTNPYKYNLTCFLTCPNNTYLDFTNVNCQACNSICKTCSLIATNCTSCTTGYLTNFTCIEKCPAGFYGLNQSCLICTSNVSACSNPLKFTVKSTSENFQNVVYIQFNQLAKITGDPTSFITINLRPARLLQAGLINGGLQFTSTVMPDGTIRLVLNPGITLNNPSFTITINDPSKISSASGDSLESLQASLDNIILINYPAGTTEDAPLVVAGTVLSVFMIILLFTVILCTPISSFLTLQAFQMISFYAIVSQLPPNLFFFLKKLSFSRLSFIPNIFEGIYKPQSTYLQTIPIRMIEIDGYLSFSKTSGSYFTILLIYAAICLVIYLLTTKYNSNRPLRELFTKIYNVRVKWGIFNDFLWLFSINVFICGFLQYRFTQNVGDLALASISLCLFLGISIGMFVHQIKYFSTEDEQKVDNYRLWHDNVKQGIIYKYIPHVYYLRKLLFAIIIASSIGTAATTATITAKNQTIALISLSSLMLVALIIVRPYQDNLRNIIHILNEIGLTFIGGAMLFYQHYVQIYEPVGTKIMCGQIITIVIIIHLSVALIWSAFRIYNFYKELHKDFTLTEFYKLYFDEKYDESIEKEIAELNDEDNGEIQSVTLTKIEADETNNEETIKLKIKRRRKIRRGEQRNNVLPRNQGNYVRLEHMEESMLSPLKNEEPNKPQDFEKMSLSQKKNMIPMDKKSQRSNQQWQKVNDQKSQQQKYGQTISNRNIFNPLLDDELQSHQVGQYEALKKSQLISQLQSQNNEKQSNGEFKLIDLQDISSVQNKEESVGKEEVDVDHLRESLSQMNFKSKKQAQKSYEKLDTDQQILQDNFLNDQKSNSAEPNSKNNLQSDNRILKTEQMKQSQQLQNVFDFVDIGADKNVEQNQDEDYPEEEIEYQSEEQSSIPIAYVPQENHQAKYVDEPPLESSHNQSHEDQQKEAEQYEPVQSEENPVFDYNPPVNHQAANHNEMELEPSNQSSIQPSPIKNINFNEMQSLEQSDKGQEQWQAMDEWQEVNNNAQEKPINKLNMNKRNNIVIDLDLDQKSQAKKVQEDIFGVPKSKQQKKSQMNASVSVKNKWDLQIEELMNEQEKQNASEKNKKHLMLFDELDFQ